jgi:glycine cleavage system P protein (glycine dehydrogenase) subunit 1
MRYHPLSEGDRKAMLATIGAASVEELYADAPASTLLKAPLDLPPHRSELEVERIFSRLSSRNTPAGRGPFFVGAGAYRRHVPASVDHLIQRSEFLTS